MGLIKIWIQWSLFLFLLFLYFLHLLRINITKQLPEEGFQKDLYTGVIDTSRVNIITYIQRVIERVFMDALAHPGAEDMEDCPMVKNLLLPGLRSFCSALKGVT